MSSRIISEESYTFSNFTDLDSVETKLVWEWRNDDKVRKWMYNTEVIPFENHLKFIESLNETQEKIYYLVKRNKLPIGVFSIVDIKDKSGEWGYYIAPEHQHRSLGIEFYYYTLNFIFEVLNFRKIVGYALLTNKSANSLNSLFGFTKKLVAKTENSEIREYYYRELISDIWKKYIKQDKKILRFLQQTENK